MPAPQVRLLADHMPYFARGDVFDVKITADGPGVITRTGHLLIIQDWEHVEIVGLPPALLTRARALAEAMHVYSADGAAAGQRELYALAYDRAYSKAAAPAGDAA